MSGTGALSLFNSLSGESFASAALKAAGTAADTRNDLEVQRDRARDLFVGQFNEAERCHDMLDQIDPDPEHAEPLDERLARVLNLVLPVAPTVSEEDGR